LLPALSPRFPYTTLFRSVVFVLLTWLAGALAGYLAGSGYPAPRLEANGGLALGVLVPIFALWSQGTPPQSSWGRLWWRVLRWQADRKSTRLNFSHASLPY